MAHPLIAMIRAQEELVMGLLPRTVIDHVDGVPVWPSHRPLPGGHQPGATADVAEIVKLKKRRSRRSTSISGPWAE